MNERAGHQHGGRGRDDRGHPGRDGRRDERRGDRGSDRRGHRGPRRYSAQAPSERSRSADPARSAAYHVLRAVAGGAYANLELPRALREGRVHGRDAAFATELTYGTLRMQGLYDAIISAAADRPAARIDGHLLDVMRLGTHQLLGMRVAAHAAADQTVGLARNVAGRGAAGLTNAVMRRISEHSLDEWIERVAPDGLAPLKRLALVHSHPEWIVKALRQGLLGHGAATRETVDAELEALLAANNAPARVALVARPGLAELAELEAAGAERSQLSPVAAHWPQGDPGSIRAVREGRAAVQDEGSQLLALALAQVPVEVDGPRRWLDLCAGPGGKAGLLAALAIERGADLVANEVSDHRADLVRQTLAPAIAAAEELGRTIEVRTGDGREVGADEPEGYARVLVDAPCTGLGALRRRPEARWRRQPSDLGSLGPLQRDLLASAIDATAPGGVIAYATCSPHLSETTFVVGDVLKKRADVEQIDARPYLRDAAGEPVKDLGDGPAVQLWPHRHGTDGMYLALLRKR